MNSLSIVLNKLELSFILIYRTSREERGKSFFYDTMEEKRNDSNKQEKKSSSHLSRKDIKQIGLLAKLLNLVDYLWVKKAAVYHKIHRDSSNLEKLKSSSIHL